MTRSNPAVVALAVQPCSRELDQGYAVKTWATAPRLKAVRRVSPIEVHRHGPPTPSRSSRRRGSLTARHSLAVGAPAALSTEYGGYMAWLSRNWLVLIYHCRSYPALPRPPTCHAGDRGFESRRSRTRDLPPNGIFCCPSRRNQCASGQQTGSIKRPKPEKKSLLIPGVWREPLPCCS